MESCGLPPLSSFPSLGLPTPNSSTLRGMWPAVALMDAQSLFASALWGPQHEGANDTANVTDFLSPSQLGSATIDQAMFPYVLSRSGMGDKRSPSDQFSLFYKMDSDPVNNVITPLE